MNQELSFDRAAGRFVPLKQAILDKLAFALGRHPASARPADWLQATELAVRDHLTARWLQPPADRGANASARAGRQVYYLSMEFLIGRTFTNALLALGIHDEVREALSTLHLDFDEIAECEPDAPLGNGGLGRLAACFLDSMAALGVAGMGYGIRYEYGMFRQKIVDGNQIEAPDYWLAGGNPWEIARPEVRYCVQFGGHAAQHGEHMRWVGAEDVLAVAYDIFIPGYGAETVNTLRLWSARATDEISLPAFNGGDYAGAVERKNRAENISRVLYPDDSTMAGRELRLRQEYFFVSASVQDMLHRHLAAHGSLDGLADSIAVHLNDTHPVLAVPELLRLLMDEHGMPWKRAWAMAQQIFSYTNHTLMGEALETWPVDLLGRLLPRHLQIIFDINAEFLGMAAEKAGREPELMRRLSLVNEHGERHVRMAFLAVVASHKVNGVSNLHSNLMTQSIFADFARIVPERFTSITNGISPRRWLGQANPGLSALIDGRIGPGWRRDLSQLSALKPLADDPAFVAACRDAKRQNKARVVQWVRAHMDIELDPDSLFDVQVKRIHEYKRQLLNLLHVITRYNRMVADPQADWVPRTVIFAGKAASAYHMAKRIIKLINGVASVINHDPRVNDRLKLLFIPNYGVSLAELIIPAADLSEQISLAGTEASGTGNMKLALNGALTVGTLDGANIEMLEQVGPDNIFIFGKTTQQVQELRARGYAPWEYYESDPELKQVLDQIRDGYFSPHDPERFREIFDALVNPADRYLPLADYASYVATQDAIDALYRQPAQWHRKAVLNIAGMSIFSSDRAIAEYASRIWRMEPPKG